MENRLIFAYVLIALMFLSAVLGVIAYRRDRKRKRKDRWR
jgi:hypothetical protein|tara:strand:- start:321 stop:440 length:120 start_codon:yes stop_codon:yes gene_type:complete